MWLPFDVDVLLVHEFQGRIETLFGQLWRRGDGLLLLFSSKLPLLLLLPHSFLCWRYARPAFLKCPGPSQWELSLVCSPREIFESGVRVLSAWMYECAVGLAFLSFCSVSRSTPSPTGLEAHPRSRWRPNQRG